MISPVAFQDLKIETNSNVQMVMPAIFIPLVYQVMILCQMGLALSPTMHRAFDRGLITINSNYFVRVSPIVDDKNSEFSITQFEGSQINLPEKENGFLLYNL